MMEASFLNVDRSLELKDLGFNEECIGIHYIGHDDKFTLELEYRSSQYSVNKGYRGGVLAPLYQQAFQWFNKKHNLFSWVYKSDIDKYHYSILKDDRYLSSKGSGTNFEDVRNQCLDSLINIIKK